MGEFELKEAIAKKEKEVLGVPEASTVEADKDLVPEEEVGTKITEIEERIQRSALSDKHKAELQGKLNASSDKWQKEVEDFKKKQEEEFKKLFAKIQQDFEEFERGIDDLAVPEDFKALNKRLKLSEAALKDYYKSYLQTPPEKRIPIPRIDSKLKFIFKNFLQGIDENLARQTLIEAFGKLINGEKENIVDNEMLMENILSLSQKMAEIEEKLKNLYGRRQRCEECIQRRLKELANWVNENPSLLEVWEPSKNKYITQAIDNLNRFRKFSSQTESEITRLEAVYKKLLITNFCNQYQLSSNNGQNTDQLLLQAHEAMDGETNKFLTPKIQAVLDNISSNPELSEFEKLFYAGKYDEALKLLEEQDAQRNRIPGLTNRLGEHDIVLTYERLKDSEEVRNLIINFTAYPCFARSAIEGGYIPIPIQENELDYPKIFLVKEQPDGSISYFWITPEGDQMGAGLRGYRQLEKLGAEHILTKEQIQQAFNQGDTDIEIENGLRKIIAKSPNFRALVEGAKVINGEFGQLQYLFQNTLKGSKPDDFVQLAKGYARKVKTSPALGNLKGNLAQAQSDLNKLTKFIITRGLKDEFKKEIEQFQKNLDDIASMVETGKIDAFCDFILSDEFSEDTAGRWCIETGLPMLSAILLATAAVVVTGMTFGLGGVGGIFLASAAGAIFGTIGNELGTVGSHYLGKAVYGDEFSNKTLLGKYLTDEKVYNPETGKYEEIKFGELTKIYGAQLVMAFITTFALMGIGGLILGPYLSRFASQYATATGARGALAKLLNKIPRLNKREVDLLEEKGFNGMVKKIGMEFLEETGEEGVETAAEKAHPVLGFLASLYHCLNGRNVAYKLGKYKVVAEEAINNNGEEALTTWSFDSRQTAGFTQTVQEEYGKQGFTVTVAENGEVTAEKEITLKNGKKARIKMVFKPSKESISMRQLFRESMQDGKSEIERLYGVRSTGENTYEFDTLTPKGKISLLVYLRREGFVITGDPTTGEFEARKGEESVKFKFSNKKTTSTQQNTVDESTKTEEEAKAEAANKTINEVIENNLEFVQESSPFYKRVNKIFQRITKAAGKPNLRLRIVNDSKINAFHAIGSNEVYIHANLIRAMSDHFRSSNPPKVLTDDHIAFILEHELVHSLQDFERVKEEMEKGDAFKAAEKKREYEADMKGMRMMVDAGFNPMAAVEVFEFFRALESNPSLMQFASVFEAHPHTADRQKRLESLLKDPNVYIEGKQREMQEFDMSGAGRSAFYDYQSGKIDLPTAIGMASNIQELQTLYLAALDSQNPIENTNILAREQLEKLYPKATSREINFIFAFNFECQLRAREMGKRIAEIRKKLTGNANVLPLDKMDEMQQAIEEQERLMAAQFYGDISGLLKGMTNEELNFAYSYLLRTSVPVRDNSYNFNSEANFVYRELLSNVEGELRVRGLKSTIDFINDLKNYQKYARTGKSFGFEPIGVSELFGELIIEEAISNPATALKLLAEASEFDLNTRAGILNRFLTGPIFAGLNLEQKLALAENLNTDPVLKNMYLNEVLKTSAQDIEAMDTEQYQTFFETKILPMLNPDETVDVYGKKVSNFGKISHLPSFYEAILQQYIDGMIRRGALENKTDCLAFLKRLEGKYVIAANDMINILNPFIQEMTVDDFLEVRQYYLSHKTKDEKWQNFAASLFGVYAFRKRKGWAFAYNPVMYGTGGRYFKTFHDDYSGFNAKPLRSGPNSRGFDMYARNLENELEQGITEDDVRFLLTNVSGELLGQYLMFDAHDIKQSGTRDRDLLLAAVDETSSSEGFREYRHQFNNQTDEDYLANYESYQDVTEDKDVFLDRQKNMYFLKYIKTHEQYNAQSVADLEAKRDFYRTHFKPDQLPNGLVSLEVEKQLVAFVSNLTGVPFSTRVIKLKNDHRLKDSREYHEYALFELDFESMNLTPEQLTVIGDAVRVFYPILDKATRVKYQKLLHRLETKVNNGTFKNYQAFRAYLETTFSDFSLYRDDVITDFVNNNELTAEQVRELRNFYSHNAIDETITQDSHDSDPTLSNFAAIFSAKMSATEKARALKFLLTGDKAHLPKALIKYGKANNVSFGSLPKLFASMSKSERRAFLEKFVIGENGVMNDKHEITPKEKTSLRQAVADLRVAIREKYNPSDNYNTVLRKIDEKEGKFPGFFYDGATDSYLHNVIAIDEGESRLKDALFSNRVISRLTRSELNDLANEIQSESDPGARAALIAKFKASLDPELTVRKYNELIERDLEGLEDEAASIDGNINLTRFLALYEHYGIKVDQGLAARVTENSAYNAFIYEFIDMALGESSGDVEADRTKDVVARALIVVFDGYPPYRRIRLLQSLMESFAGKENMPIEVKIRRIFENCGASGVKVAQFLADKANIIPNEKIRRELAELKDRANPFDKGAMFDMSGKFKKVKVKKIGRTLGSASIKQVHEVEIEGGEPGVRYVGKFKRPTLEQDLEEDIPIMRALAAEFKESGMPDLSGRVKAIILEEADFRIEARNQQDLGNNIAKLKIGRFTFRVPKVLEVQEDMMIEEQATGTTLKDFETAGKVPDGVYEAVVKSFFHQVFVDGVFHADLHQGNVYIEGDQITFIDVGLVGRIDKLKRANYFRFLQRLSSSDGSGMGRLIESQFLHGDARLTAEEKAAVEVLIADGSLSTKAKMEKLLAIIPSAKLDHTFSVFVKGLASIGPYLDKSGDMGPYINALFGQWKKKLTTVEKLQLGVVSLVI